MPWRRATSANKRYFAVDPRYFRPTEVETLLGGPTKAAEHDELIKKHGYKAMDYHE